MIGRLPPPAPGTHILTRLNGACTGFATDTGVASIMQLVIRDMMQLDIVPHLLFRPRNKWIDLDELVHLVPLDHLYVLVRHTLLSAQTAYPGIKALKSTSQRLQLAYLAATMPTLYGVVEKVDALFLHHTLHFVIVWEKHFQLDSIRQVRLVDELVRFWEESPRIECEDTRSTLTDYYIRQCLVFDA